MESPNSVPSVLNTSRPVNIIHGVLFMWVLLTLEAVLEAIAVLGALIPAPNELAKQKLCKIKHDKYCLPFIDLAVGET